MSATGRGRERRQGDAYYTPAWCVWRLLDAVSLWGLEAWEPCAGGGSVIAAAEAHGGGPIWTHATEPRSECAPALWRLVPTVRLGSCLEERPAVEVALSNPPYGLAGEIAAHLVECVPRVALLLRLGWLASSRRAAWMREHTPRVLVLPQRPSFTGCGSDATDYAWMLWGLGPPTIEVLEDTPIQLRSVS